MCWPSVDGGIVVEERRRRHPNEPRRKRLNFVKEHGSNDSDEWDLIQPQPRRHRQETVERPHPHPQQPWQYDPRWAHPHYQQPMQPHPLPMPLHPSQPQMGFHGDQNRLDRHSYHDPDEIIRVEEFVPRDDHKGPHIVERAPREAVSRLPSHVRARSRSRARGHSRHGSLFSDDSYSDSRHGARRRHEPPYSDNDSFEDLRPGSRRRINRVTRFRRIQ